MLGIGWERLLCLVSLIWIVWIVGLWFFFFLFFCVGIMFCLVYRDMFDSVVWVVRYLFLMSFCNVFWI